MDAIYYVAKALADRDMMMNPAGEIGDMQPPEPFDHYEDMAEAAIRAYRKFELTGVAQ